MNYQVTYWLGLTITPPTIENGYAWIKSVIKDIYKKSDKVIEHIGDYQIKS